MFTDYEIPLRIENSGILYSNNLSEDIYEKLPNTEFIMNNTFWIGFHPALSQKELVKISDAIHSFFLNFEK